MKSRPIKLNDKKPLASGSSRQIFEHPAQPDCLIKVLRRPTSSTNVLSGAYWTFRFQQRQLLREIGEYVRVLSNPEDPLNRHLPALHGLISSDLGFGQVVEAQREATGKLAPTLTHLLRAGKFSPEHVAPLEELFDDLLKSSAVVGDLNGGNIVLTQETSADSHTQWQFSLVDGLGDKTIIPMQWLSTWVKNRQKKQSVEKLRKRYQKRLGNNPIMHTNATRG